ncbi:MAG: dioxygenase [Actinomycetota bacterium]
MTRNFTPEQHLAEVLASFDGSTDDRLAEVSRAAVRHLHAFAAEVGLSREEWFAGIQFLTAVGQMCDDVRQEFILLSDTLGVSMLVEMLDQDGSDGTTEPTVFGPFHVDGAPPRENGDSIIETELGGDPLVVEGAVRDLDGAPIAGATVDVWQTAANGLYDVQDADQAPMNCRGVFTTDRDGRYAFRTVRPVDYTIPDDGPVGAWLGAVGRHPWRPAHIHLVAAADGFVPITTHLFDATSEYLGSDAVFGVRESLAVDVASGSARFDVVLDRS